MLGATALTDQASGDILAVGLDTSRGSFKIMHQI